jgi:hypothetical protein
MHNISIHAMHSHVLLLLLLLLLQAQVRVEVAMEQACPWAPVLTVAVLAA